MGLSPTRSLLAGANFRGRRHEVVLATKLGIVRTEDPHARPSMAGAEYVRSACEASLRRLGVETIDLYYQHRVDPNTPIEETVAAMAERCKKARSGTWA